MAWGEGNPLVLLNPIDVLDPGIPQQRHTAGALVLEGQIKPLKWALSGHSMPDPAPTRRALSNRFWTRAGETYNTAPTSGDLRWY